MKCDGWDAVTPMRARGIVICSNQLAVAKGRRDGFQPSRDNACDSMPTLEGDARAGSPPSYVGARL